MNYNDLSLRQTLSSMVTEHAGGCNSPDIIPYGITAETQLDIFKNKYNSDLGKNLVLDKNNYIYVRCKNNSQTERRLGRIYLGAAEPCFLLWPDKLQFQKTESGEKYYELDVKSNSIDVSEDPFIYKPNNSGDYLAAYITTQEHPIKQLPCLKSVKELKDFLEKHPAYAQRNCITDISIKKDYIYSGIYEQRDGAKMMFSINWSNCPVEWGVSLISNTKDCPIKIDITKLQQTTAGTFSKAMLPNNFSTTFTLTIKNNSVLPNNNSWMEVIVYWVDDSSFPNECIPLSGHRFYA